MLKSGTVRKNLFRRNITCPILCSSSQHETNRLPLIINTFELLFYLRTSHASSLNCFSPLSPAGSSPLLPTTQSIVCLNQTKLSIRLSTSQNGHASNPAVKCIVCVNCNGINRCPLPSNIVCVSTNLSNMCVRVSCDDKGKICKVHEHV